MRATCPRLRDGCFFSGAGDDAVDFVCSAACAAMSFADRRVVFGSSSSASSHHRVTPGYPSIETRKVFADPSVPRRCSCMTPLCLHSSSRMSAGS